MNDEGNHEEDEEQYQTLQETAEDFQVSTGTLRTWLKQGLIKGVKPSGKETGRVRISIREIKAFIGRHIKHEEEGDSPNG